MWERSAGWMDKIYKKTLMDCSVSTQKVRYPHAADVCYNLDCWLVLACLPGAIVTSKTTSLICCMCNRQHRWPGANVSDMHTCRHKFTDMTVG